MLIDAFDAIHSDEAHNQADRGDPDGELEVMGDGPEEPRSQGAINRLRDKDDYAHVEEEGLTSLLLSILIGPRARD